MFIELTRACKYSISTTSEFYPFDFQTRLVHCICLYGLCQPFFICGLCQPSFIDINLKRLVQCVSGYQPISCSANSQLLDSDF